MTKFKKNLKIFVLVIGIVFIWRGVWGLADIFLFPENQLLSRSFCVVIGLFILYLHNHNIRELLKIED